MALILSYEIAAPSPRECNVDAPITGGSMASLVDLTNHLALARSRRVVHSSLSYQLPKNYTSYDAATDTADLDQHFPVSSRTVEIPWLSSPLARYAWIRILLRAQDNSSILAELYQLNAGGVAVKLDGGCEWTLANQGLADLSYQVNDSTQYALGVVSTGATPRTAGAGVDEPRPLIIPVANRGDELMIKFTCVFADLFSVDIFELYEGSWS